jgi:prepilin-type N-terminal cleavage/methylation domain-containing protein
MFGSHKISKKGSIGSGFTLVELLVVMAILAILTTLISGSFMSSQMKGRDARRRSDLSNVQKALEMYLNDAKTYPASLSFGDAFSVAGTVYMAKLPSDPQAPSRQYYYAVSADGQEYYLFADLERPTDRDGSYVIGSTTYELGLSSPNTSPGDFSLVGLGGAPSPSPSGGGILPTSPSPTPTGGIIIEGL